MSAVVVGGGLAGLVAARELLRQGTVAGHEVAAAVHRVQQVVGDVGPGERAGGVLVPGGVALDDLDAADFDEDGSPILHAGDVDGVDIVELDEDAEDDDDEDDDDDSDDDEDAEDEADED